MIHNSEFTEISSGATECEPHGENPLVGIKGTCVELDGLILRRSKDQGGIVISMEVNKYPEWGFTYTTTDRDLHLPEGGGV